MASNIETLTKAKAYDDIQKEAVAKQKYLQGGMDAESALLQRLNEMAYIGRNFDGYMPMTDEMRRDMQTEMQDPRMYDPSDIPAGYTQGQNSIQGAPVAPAQPMPDLRYSNETKLPAPEGQSALMAAMGGRQ